MMNLIEVSQVTKTFPEGFLNERTVLNNIDLIVRKGDFVVLQGANGIGKSTLLKIILGLQEPDSGTVKLFEQSPKTPASKLQVGTIFQEVNPPTSLKVKELINLVRSYYPNPCSTQDVLQSVGLENQQHLFPSNLSGGQKQRLYFAIALVGNPQLLILDEPTKSLDKEGQKIFWEQVERCRENNVTILMVTHIDAEESILQNLATHIFTLTDGKIVYDKQPSESPHHSTEEDPPAAPRHANPVNVLWMQIKTEIIQLLRTPSYLVGVILLSSLACILPIDDSSNTVKLLVPFGELILLLLSIDQLSKRISIERVEGWLKLLKVTPLSTNFYLLAKLVMVMLVLVTSLITVLCVGIFKFHINQSIEEWAAIGIGLLLGIIPFAIIGITLGYIIPPKTINVFTGLLICAAIGLSGSFSELMPDYINNLTTLLPFFHYTKIVEFATDFNSNVDHLILHIAWLLFYCILGGLIAKQAYERDSLAQ